MSGLMKKSILLVVFTSILCLQSYAERLKNLSANYIGEKMWNTVKMVPYNGSVSLEINDSLAYLKYNRTERVDTFFLIVRTMVVIDIQDSYFMDFGSSC